MVRNITYTIRSNYHKHKRNSTVPKQFWKFKWKKFPLMSGCKGNRKSDISRWINGRLVYYLIINFVGGKFLMYVPELFPWLCWIIQGSSDKMNISEGWCHAYFSAVEITQRRKRSKNTGHSFRLTWAVGTNITLECIINGSLRSHYNFIQFLWYFFSLRFAPCGPVHDTRYLKAVLPSFNNHSKDPTQE